METLLYLLYMAAGRAPMIPLDEALRPTWLFGSTVHEGCDRGGYYEQAQFAEEYGSPLCIVKLGCWGPVVQCNVGKRGWMGGIGGCPNVGGICIGCTMPGFPDKFMPFMNQPPGSLLSSAAVQTYGRAIHALRKFTQASLNKVPSWRRQPAVHRPGRLTSKLRVRIAASEDAMALLAQTEWRDRPPEREPECEEHCRAAGSGRSRSAAPRTGRRLRSSNRTSASSTPRPHVRRRHASNLEAKYRALLEQIPAVVFMAYLDRGVSEAYVSPEIEAALGYSREEWLEDPVRWYDHIHPDDKQRWSLEAAEHVSLRQAAALLVSRDRARRARRLVPLRRPHGAPPRWLSPGSSTASPSTSPT